MDKGAIVQGVIDQLRDQHATLERAAEAAAEGATHEEAKPENDKDTRALEASYLAGAQAAKARELLAAMNVLRFLPLRASSTVELGSLVRVGSRAYIVLPHGGGLKVQNITVVTPASPIGAALMGQSEGDIVEIGGREIAIDEVT